MPTLSSKKTATSYSNEELYQRYLSTNDEYYLNEIVEKNRFAVYSVVNKYNILPEYARLNNIDYKDLRQEGILGYWDGLRRYTQDGGCKVNSYCMFWVKKRVSDFYEKFSRIVRYPENVSREAKRVNITGEIINPKLMPSTQALVKSYNTGIAPLENDEIEYEDNNESDFNVELAYFNLILSTMTDEDRATVCKLIDWDTKSNNGNHPVVIRMRVLFQKLRQGCLFILPLERNGQFLMSKETYEEWHNGTCGDEKNIYPAISVYNIEKKRLGFTETKLPSGEILLKI